MMSNSIPLGEIRLDFLRQNPVTEWFAMGSDMFSFDDAESYRRLLGAQDSFAQREILAFIGIWCGDCQDHLPGFSRVLDAIGFPAKQLRVYALDRKKTFPGGAELIARHGISKLPTFIFFKDGQETGRITESPAQSLLKDMATYLSRGA